MRRPMQNSIVNTKVLSSELESVVGAINRSEALGTAIGLVGGLLDESEEDKLNERPVE